MIARWTEAAARNGPRRAHCWLSPALLRYVVQLARLDAEATFLGHLQDGDQLVGHVLEQLLGHPLVHLLLLPLAEALRRIRL